VISPDVDLPLRGARARPPPHAAHELRADGELIEPKRRAPGKRLPPIVALLDFSGSMSEYSRVVLHFLHALAESRGGVSTFLFGTRLTNVTRAVRTRDPDAALRACGQATLNWSGGTWISSSLHRFNQDWSRRVLGQGAHVLLFTDGLERETGDSPAEKACPGLDPGWEPVFGKDHAQNKLSREIDRLHRSSKRLICHADEMRPVHNLESLESLCMALS
jgi:uncharacterized protein with von Willebrand factor type A (vWA) domain